MSLESDNTHNTYNVDELHEKKKKRRGWTASAVVFHGMGNGLAAPSTCSDDCNFFMINSVFEDCFTVFSAAKELKVLVTHL